MEHSNVVITSETNFTIKYYHIIQLPHIYIINTQEKVL